MNCEKCRWYKRTYPVYTFGEFSARCMLGGCDESRYDPRDGKDEGAVERKKGEWMHKEITADFHIIGQCSVCKERRRIDNFCPNCGAKMEES